MKCYLDKLVTCFNHFLSVICRFYYYELFWIEKQKWEFVDLTKYFFWEKWLFLKKNEIFWNLMVLRVNFVLMYNSQFLSHFNSYTIKISGFFQSVRICAKFKFFVIFGWNLTEFQKTNFFVKLVTSFGQISVKNGENHQSLKNSESPRKI